MTSWLLPVLLAIGGVIDDDTPAGVRLSARVGGGMIAHDVVGIVDVGAGIESAPFGLHLRVPLTLRAVDNAPLVPPSSPSMCRVLRCEELLRGQELDPTVLARIIDEVRFFQPDDIVHARAGQLVATVGAGAVVDRLTTLASWDRRTSGAWGALRLPWSSFAAEVLVADVVSPLELLAARVEGAPPVVPIVVGIEVGADAIAPVDVVDDTGAARATGRTRPVVVGAIDARLPVRLSAFTFAPRLELGGSSGLAVDGIEAGIGGGAGIGADVGFDAGFAALQARGVVGVTGGAHRRGVFSTFHLVERRQALLGSVVDGGGYVHVPAPAGADVDLRLQASILDVVSPLLRVHLEPAPGANAVEAGVVVDLDVVQVSGSVIRRGFVDLGGVVDGDVGARPLLLAVEAGWRFWGPLSASVRWFRLPRFSGGALVVDNDVLVSLSVNGVLTPR